MHFDLDECFKELFYILATIKQPKLIDPKYLEQSITI